MKGEIISVGTELLLGQITDTNASWLAQNLSKLGISCFYISQIGDNLRRLATHIKQAWNRSEIIVITGGLGPTEDDLTREAISMALEEKLYIDTEITESLKKFFADRKIYMPSGNTKQANLISSAHALKNTFGTAPGWWVNKDDKIIIAMPGIPEEMKNMWTNQVEPRLRNNQANKILVTRTFKILELAESTVGELIQPLLTKSNPTIATYVKKDGIHVSTTALAANLKNANSLLDEIETEVRNLLSVNIYGVNDITIAEVVANLLKELNITIAIAEAFTGGLVTNDISGAAGKYFYGGLIHREPNKIISLEEDTQSGLKHAKTMATDVVKKFQADIGLGIASYKIQAEGNYESGRRSYYVIVNSNGKEIISKTRLDTTAPTINKKRVSLNAIDFLRRYLISKNLPIHLYK